MSGEAKRPYLPMPRYVGLNVPSSLEGAWNRGWNACIEAIRTGRTPEDLCAYCCYTAGHALDCPGVTQ